MSIPIPTPTEITELLGLPFGPLQTSARETDSDAGYFGPESVTWKVMREPLLVLGSLRALLMQAAHPLVAEGALKTRSFEHDPWGRFRRTAQWVGIVVFGTKHEADMACDAVGRAHRGIAGRLREEHATASTGGKRGIVGGTVYSARSPDLVRWVHATLTETLLVTHEAFVGRMPVADQDRFVQEWNVIGFKMGMARHDAFTTRAEMSGYIRDAIDNGPVGAGAGSREVSQTILHSPMLLADPLWRASAFFSIGLLPGSVRSQFGISWWLWDEAGFRSTLRLVRQLRAVTPSPLRQSAGYKWAVRRARGDLASTRRQAYA